MFPKIYLLSHLGQNLLLICLPVFCCPLQSVWTSFSCMRASVCRNALHTSTLKTSTAFPAMPTARIATGRILMTALHALSACLSFTMACVLKSALKGVTMKKTPKTAKVGSCCFPLKSTEIQVGPFKGHPLRVCV